MGAYCISLAISIWSNMRKWLLTGHKTNHHCGTITLMTHLRSGLIAQCSYIISSATLIVKRFHPVHHGNRVRQCNSLSWYSGHQERDHWPLKQNSHALWPISQLQFWPLKQNSHTLRLISQLQFWPLKQNSHALRLISQLQFWPLKQNSHTLWLISQLQFW
jgi:hypothetical protein